MNLLFLKAVSVETLFIIIAIVAVLAAAFAALIVLVSKLCEVPTDEKADKIKERLAGANCGGCGFAGCADFAKALSEGKTEISACGATSPEDKAAIAEILGMPFSAEEATYAVVHCAGGDNCQDKFGYVGNDGCVFASDFSGGSKVCSSGCLGGGTCASVCPDNAIKIKNGAAVTDKALCASCGACVKKCPKHIIGLIPKSSKIYVACSSTCKGKDVMSACKVGCIACGICAKVCPEGAISIVDNFPVIDYKKCAGCLICANKCPRKCIKII